MPDAGYLQYLREVCTQHGALLIFDEVMTGFRLAEAACRNWKRSSPTSPASAKSSAAACPSEPSVDAPISWTGSLRLGRLSGRHAQRQSARHGAGIAALKLLEELDPYAPLDRLGGSCATLSSPRRAPRDRCPGAAVRLDVQHLFQPRSGPRLHHGAPVRRQDFGRFFHACLAQAFISRPAPSRPVSSARPRRTCHRSRLRSADSGDPGTVTFTRRRMKTPFLGPVPVATSVSEWTCDAPLAHARGYKFCLQGRAFSAFSSACRSSSSPLSALRFPLRNAAARCVAPRHAGRGLDRLPGHRAGIFSVQVTGIVRNTLGPQIADHL